MRLENTLRSPAVEIGELYLLDLPDEARLIADILVHEDPWARRAEDPFLAIEQLGQDYREFAEIGCYRPEDLPPLCAAACEIDAYLDDLTDGHAAFAERLKTDPGALDRLRAAFDRAGAERSTALLDRFETALAETSDPDEADLADLDQEAKDALQADRLFHRLAAAIEASPLLQVLPSDMVEARFEQWMRSSDPRVGFRTVMEGELSAAGALPIDAPDDPRFREVAEICARAAQPISVLRVMGPAQKERDGARRLYAVTSIGLVRLEVQADEARLEHEGGAILRREPVKRPWWRVF